MGVFPRAATKVARRLCLPRCPLLRRPICLPDANVGEGVGTVARRVTSSLACSSTGKLVLGIETSCDDTAAAVLSDRGAILGECVISSVEMQAKWGGVVPKLAQQAHMEAIDEVVESTLEQAKVRPEDLSAVAVTIGPGLSLCLKVGVLKAREVAYNASVPLIPIHHMEAHALVARLCAVNPRLGGEGYEGTDGVRFPFLALLVSGGHNLLVLVKGIGNYAILGTTLDDAIGEAYDKVARLLGLDLSRGGGPALESFALEGDATRYAFAVPLKNSRDKAKTCDFSFAGLKTAVRTRIEAEIGSEPTSENRQLRADMAAAFQRVAIEHICLRTKRAVQWSREDCPGIDTLVVAGGVASNEALRHGLRSVAEGEGMHLVCPPARLCTDNGAMIAWTGIERLALNLGVGSIPVSAKPAENEYVDLKPRWPLGQVDGRSSQPQTKSMKRKNVKVSLTEETLLAAAEKAKIRR